MGSAMDSERPNTSVVSYRGRFAPSPTGPLHLGSLLSALTSYLDARANGGEWLLRIDDVDPQRSLQTHADSILGTLEAHGLLWDGTVVYQSTRLDRYALTLKKLESIGAVFTCACSRRQIKEALSLPCTSCSLAARSAARRLHLAGFRVEFEDRVLGLCRGDFRPILDEPVLMRRDGVFAYQLAVVADDHDAQITDIVRGSDLLNETFAQVAIYDRLGWKRPSYAHCPLVIDKTGRKLSKQNFAEPLSDSGARASLARCLQWLGLPSDGGIESMLAEAVDRWQIQRLRPHGNWSVGEPAS